VQSTTHGRIDRDEEANEDCGMMYQEGDIDRRWIGAAIQCSNWHFHRQLFERYGIVLPPGEFTYIARTIEAGEAMLIEERAKGQAIYAIRLPTSKERIYVLAKGQALITAWPPSKRLNDTRRALARSEQPA
jgi:hypothetical protein